MVHLKHAAKAALLAAVLATSNSLKQREEPATDTLASELTDQADPEFEAMANGDNCISNADLDEYIDSQMPPEPVCEPGVPADHCQYELDEYNKMKQTFHEQGKTMHAYADRCVTGKEDGCVDKAEFVKMNEMEGPPPGFEEDAAEGMVEGELDSTPSHPPCDSMDRNKDGTITKGEAKGYCKELGEDDMSASFMADVYLAYMDKDESGGVSCQEYDASMKAMETPAGQAALSDAMQKTIEKQQEDVRAVECDMMDDNGDGMVSNSEAYNYVSEMEGADLTSTTVEEIVTAADKNEDGFISREECLNAGKEYDGDGAEDNEKDQVGHDGNEGKKGKRKQKKEKREKKKSFLQKPPMSPKAEARLKMAKKLVNPQKTQPKRAPHKLVNLWQLLVDIKSSPKLHWRPEFRWLLYRVPSLQKFGAFVKRHGQKLSQQRGLKNGLHRNSKTPRHAARPKNLKRE